MSATLAAGTAARTARPRRRPTASFRWMVAPALLFAAAMIVLPFGWAIWLSLQETMIGTEPRFAGLDNYRRLAADGEFWNGFRLTMLLWLLSLALQLVAGTWLGLLLARLDAARGLVRTVLISPFMLPPVVIGMMAIVILDPGLGVANWLLGRIGLGPHAVPRGSRDGDPDRRADRHLAMDALRRADRARRLPLAAARRLRGGGDRRRGRGAALPPHHPAAARADAGDGRGAAQRRPAALLRRHLHHDPGRAGQCQHHAQHPRLSPRLRVLRVRLCGGADGDALGHRLRLGPRLRAAARAVAW
jgi:hypothetical protein